MAVAFNCLAQPAGTKLWEFSTAGRVGSSPAVGPDGTIYFGGGAYLYALSPNGARIWVFFAGGQIHSSPAVWSDGTIYFGSLNGLFFAINSEGALKWTFELRDRIYSSPALGLDGTVYFGADDGSVYALTPRGAKKWAFDTGGYVRSSPAIGADGTVYIGSWDKKLYAISPAGARKWSFQTGHYIYSSPAIDIDGTVYVASADGKVYAVNPDGTQKWVFQTAGHIYSSPVIGPDGTVYIGSWDNKLYALNPTGTLKWTFVTADIIQSSPVIGADGSIYFGSDENKIYAVAPDGIKKWDFSASSLVRSSPVLTADGVLYFGCEQSKFYALRGVTGLAVSPWPMLRSDPSRRGKVLLMVTQHPESQMLVVNSPAKLQAAAQGAGPLFYQWKLNGANVPGAKASHLTITNVQPTDAGEYTLEISNAVEVVSSSPASLTVIVPPEITLQPQSQTVPINSNVVFKVAASSLVQVHFQWSFNRTNIAGAETSELVLPAVQPTNAGDYAVLARNAAGQVKSQVATLIVIVPPEITSQPEDHVVVSDTNLTFTVAATSMTPLAFQWRLNGKNIPGATSDKLELTNVTAKDAGIYTAEVSNMGGKVISTPAKLTVVERPEITAQPKSQTAVAGKSATFEVAAASAAPLAYQWFFQDTNIQGATSQKLQLNDIQPENAGPYTVMISNIAGVVISAPAELKVFIGPKILTQPLGQTGALGKDIAFSVVATGSPPLYYSWQLNGTNLLDATNASLHLFQLTPDMAGEYRVVVTNTADSVTSKPAALAIPPPTFWERIKSWF